MLAVAVGLVGGSAVLADVVGLAGSVVDAFAAVVEVVEVAEVAAFLPSREVVSDASRYIPRTLCLLLFGNLWPCARLPNT